MMKKEETKFGKMAWGLLIAAFGIFFLIANLVPNHHVIRYWPIFLIAAGGLKFISGCWCHCFKE